jgi:ATP-dependent RNA helicase DeaD
MTEFKDLWIWEKTLAALTKKWFVTPSPIQEKVIPLLLQGEKNVIGQAATGTGKTAAFGIPLIEKLTPGGKVQALILAPTRELATQIAQEIDSLQGNKGLKVMAIYGKQSYEIQHRALKRGIDILVGTPGRIMDHLDRKTLDLSHLDYFILDEADEMLDMGFVEDIEKIFKTTNPEKKVLLFSATMPREILQIAKKYIGEYELIATEKTEITGEQTDQTYFEVQERDKFELLRRIMDTETDFYGIIFCHTKADVDELASRLNDEWYTAEGLHGDLAQKQREHFLKRFKDKKVSILVATDVAARGIDVNNVTHVINYAIPQNAERYTHRIGRTWRAGKEWTAITFITPREYSKMSYIKKVNKVDIKKGQIPDIKWVIEKKKDKLHENIQGVLSKESHKAYTEIADKLIEKTDPRDVVAALLKMHYESDFDQSKYRDIVEQTRENRFASKWGQWGKTRLFVALGRREWYNARSLLELITEESWVQSRDIDDLKMMDDFSFISVSPSNAEIITWSFANKTINGKKAIINKAKEPSGDSRDSRSPRRSFGDKPSYPRREYKESKTTRSFGERKEYTPRKSYGDKKEFGSKRNFWSPSTNVEKKSYGNRREFWSQKDLLPRKNFKRS